MIATRLYSSRTSHRASRSANRRVEPFHKPRVPWVRFIEGSGFAGYIGLISFGVANHAPWADEIQSWLLARDLSPAGLVVHQLRYEGSPGLWQFILWPFAQVHLPVITLNVIGAAIAVLGVAFLIFCSPLPLIFRLLVPFTFFIGFQYAVIARPYNLLVPLIFGLAITFRRRFQHPLRYTLVLCLISAVSVQMTVVAASLFVVYLAQSFRHSSDRKNFDQRFRGALTLFTGFETVLAAILWPTPDNAFTAGLITPNVHAFVSSFASLTLGSGSFTTLAIVNVPLVLAVCVWLHTKGLLSNFLVPFLALAGMGAATDKGGPWLQGFNLLLLIFALWIGIEHPRTANLRFGRAVYLAVLGLSFSAVAVQISWTASAYSWSLQNPYGPGEAASRFLSDHYLLHDSIASDGDYWAIDLEPYLPNGSFANLAAPGAYYHWSKRTDYTTQLFAPLIARTDQVIIAGPDYVGMPFERGLLSRLRPRFFGYKLVQAIPSGIFWPGTTDIRSLGLYIFVRDDVRLRGVPSAISSHN